jgi:hypothetical protein
MRVIILKRLSKNVECEGMDWIELANDGIER